MAAAVRRSAWLGAAAVDELGLHLPGRPVRHAAALAMRPDGVGLRAGTAIARLSWDDHGPWDGRPLPPGCSRWWVTHFAVSRRGVHGVAVGVAGGALAETEPVRSEVVTWRNRLARPADQRAVVPLCSGGFSSADGERGTLAALCSILARRPELRERLADVERIRALVEAMAARPLAARLEEYGLRWRTVEVLFALRSLGYRYEVEGRPLPGGPSSPGPSRRCSLDRPRPQRWERRR